MNPIPHPSSFIDAQTVNALRQLAPEAEQMRSLHPEQLTVIYQNRWFNLFVPTAYAGLGLSLPGGLKTEEALAWIDGSVGWTVTLCSGANWFIGFLETETAATFFSSEKVCFAGSDRASGIAKIINQDTYEISGSWQYATGAAHATAFTANCLIEKDGKIVEDKNGVPVVAPFIFLRSEVTIHEDWKGMGMIATSSDRFEVRNVRVNKNRRFSIDENKPALQDKIYQYPFLQFAESTLAVNISGMALHFLDLFETIIKGKKINDYFTKERQQQLFLKLEAARSQQNEARQAFYQTVQRSWDEEIFTASDLKNVTNSSRHLSATSLRVVDEIFPYCGLMASDPASEINRVWRNLHTATLHPLVVQ